MSSVVIAGDTSGSITLQAPAVAGTTVLTVPSGSGTLTRMFNGTSVASTSGTSIDFTGIPDWAKRITVMLTGVSTNGASVPMVQLGDSGGIENVSYIAASGTITTTANTTRGQLFTTGFGMYGTSSAGTFIFHGIITLVNVTGNTWVGSGVIHTESDGSTSTVVGSKTLSATLDRLRLTTVNGTDTFDAGSINIFYEG